MAEILLSVVFHCRFSPAMIGIFLDVMVLLFFPPNMQIWALAIGKKSEMFATGGEDAVINLWCDSTAADKEENFRKEVSAFVKVHLIQQNKSKLPRIFPFVGFLFALISFDTLSPVAALIKYRLL